MMLEREADRAVFEAALSAARSAGRIVLVSGEAGIGKTTLVRDVVDAADGLRVLWGACDPLVVARSLGPLHDIARRTGGALAAALVAGDGREPLLGALLDELAARPTAIVVEDVQWADEATLDLVALIARRLPDARGCLVLTCRSDAVAGRGDVLRVLDSLPTAQLVRIEPAPLSPAAVERLARDSGRDPTGVYALTGGNPFFVAEVLASEDPVPASVQAAVLVRVDGLPTAARAVAEVVSVVPRHAELGLIADAVAAPAAAIDLCLSAGLLALDGSALTFRHALARDAVEASLGPLRRRELHAAVLAALERHGGTDVARLAHHAHAAGDAAATRRLAAAAAARASRAGAHKQALAHWEAALAAAGGDDLSVLEGVAFEAYLCGRNERALEARQAELAAAHARRDTVRTGSATRWIARLQWLLGRGPEAAVTAERAVSVLRGGPPGRELAMALSTRSQLAMLADRPDVAIVLGEEAMALARRLGDRATLAHALTNVGAARLGGPAAEQGRAELEQAFALARAAGHVEHAMRALANLGMVAQRYDPAGPRSAADLERALAFARAHDLDGPRQHLLGARALHRLLRGDWAGADADARTSLDAGRAGPGAGAATLVLGRLQARRGEPDAEATLDAARRLAASTRELHRVAAVAAARVEHAWLEGDGAPAVAQARWLDLERIARRYPLAHAELAFWLARAAAPETAAADGGGAGAAAGAAWEALGFPYESAVAAGGSGDPPAALDALGALEELGAIAAARRVRRLLALRGVRGVPRGPRPASRAAPGGLTPRQLEVAHLLTTGATNAEIARQLVVSPRTAGHHVSAVLSKLGLRSRREVGAAAARLGLTPT